jgi:FkbM family methyltransferase
MSLVKRLKSNASSALKQLTAKYVYDLTYGNIKITRRGGLGFLKKGGTPEERFLGELKLKDFTIYDIGGYIGLMAVFFSKKSGPGGQIFVFEPNEDNIKKINEHLDLNQSTNTTVINLGIGEGRKSVSFVVSEVSTATGSVNKAIQQQLKSLGAYKEITIEVDSLDNVAKERNLPKPDFIKVDIEGMEYPALLGMHEIVRKYAPRFFMEIHGATDIDKLENISKIFEWFQAAGYSLYHVETHQVLNKDNFTAAKQGHIYCTHSSNP